MLRSHIEQVTNMLLTNMLLLTDGTDMFIGSDTDRQYRHVIEYNTDRQYRQVIGSNTEQGIA